MGHGLDIIICTYNREPELLDCLDSLEQQDFPNGDWQLVVVNNYGEPLSEEVQKKIYSISSASILNEPIAGLSHARNHGIEKSEAAWLGFLDDDAKVPSDFIRRAFEIINENEFDCFGGHIRSWWKYGRPRWLDLDYGSKPLLREERGKIRDGYNWGSNIFIKITALDKVGGFPENIGLKGADLGYSAENIVQIKLREHNYVIGYDPNLYIDHVVMPAKLKLWWHLKAAYATGRDGRTVFPDQYGLKGILVSFKNCFSRPLKAIWRWLTVYDYYWEHVVLESGKAWSLWLGKLISTALNNH